jgi:protein TonB
MEDNKKYLNQSMDEIVFDNRNKSYGAFFLRQLTKRNTLVALIIVGTLSLLLTSFTFVDFGFLGKKSEELSVERVVTLAEPPPLDETALPPPPPPPPPPPVRPTVKFVEMVVKKDEEVVDDEVVDVTAIDKDIATVDQEGDEDAEPIIEEIKVVQAPVVEEKKIHQFLEQMPEFPGGPAKLMAYFQQNIKYPRMANENGVEGTVYIKFVVDEKGEISQASVARGIGAGCDEEALRAVKAMPNWTPGKQNGKPAAVWYTVPVKFTLDN